jgi:hypothetical protein
MEVYERTWKYYGTFYKWLEYWQILPSEEGPGNNLPFSYWGMAVQCSEVQSCAVVFTVCRWILFPILTNVSCRLITARIQEADTSIIPKLLGQALLPPRSATRVAASQRKVKEDTMKIRLDPQSPEVMSESWMKILLSGVKTWDRSISLAGNWSLKCLSIYANEINWPERDTRESKIHVSITQIPRI